MGARAFRPPPRQRPGRALLTAEVMSLETALADPLLGAGTLAALAAAEMSRPGGRMSECSVCLEPWGPERRPLRTMVVQLRGVANIGFVCPACSSGTSSEVLARVRARVRADVPDLRESTLVHQAGRA